MRLFSWTTLVFAVFEFAGCTTKAPPTPPPAPAPKAKRTQSDDKLTPLIKYDPVQNSSLIYKRVRSITISHRPGVTSELYVSLSGEGSHPITWTCYLAVVARGPKGCPNLLLDPPRLVIHFAARDSESLDTPVEGFVLPQARGGPHEEEAFFQVSSRDLLKLSGNGRITLDGKSFFLNQRQRNILREVLMSARQATVEGLKQLDEESRWKSQVADQFDIDDPMLSERGFNIGNTSPPPQITPVGGFAPDSH